MQIISRAVAKSAGRRFYYTGQPCPSGHVARRYVSGFGCTECLRYAPDRYQRMKRACAERNTRHRRKKQKRLTAYKANRPCTDCGIYYPSCVMDFDHVRGEKTMDVSRMVAYGWDTVMQEIDKCDLVCANCHRIRTEARRQRAH